MATWINGSGAKTTRHATSWLIRRFVDPDADFLYGATNEEREALMKRAGVRGLLYFHPHPHDTLETLAHDLDVDDRALPLFLAIVRTAAHGNGYVREPEGPGIGAVVKGILAGSDDDAANLKALMPVFDALFAYCDAEVGRGRTVVGRPLTDSEKESLAPAKQTIAVASYAVPITLAAG